jgi:hypothetical protein
LLILIVLPVLLQTACGPDYYFEENKSDFEGSRWAYSRYAGLSVLGDGYPGDVQYCTSTSSTPTRFPNQNLSTSNCTLSFPDGKRLGQTEVISICLMHQGKSLGEVLGRYHLQACTPCFRSGHFSTSRATYVITLEQYTRSNPLPGIKAVGLTLEATGVKR